MIAPIIKMDRMIIVIALITLNRGRVETVVSVEKPSVSFYCVLWTKLAYGKMKQDSLF